MTNNSKPEDYKKVAKKLGVKHLFGRWGISRAKAPSGIRNWRWFKIIPLDGWITDPKEVYRVMEKKDFEL